MKGLNNLRDKIFAKKDDETILENIYVLMKEFGYTLDEVQKLPIPTFKYLLYFLEKEAKATKKAMDKKKGKKR